MNKVYGVALSPYVRKVLFALEYKDADYQLEMTLPFQTPSAYKRINPLRKIPGFEDDYLTLPESSVICQYLDEKYPHNSYYPRDFREKARALWFENFADNHLSDVLLPFWVQRKVMPLLFGRAGEERLVRRAEKQVPAVASLLEKELGTAGFLFADGLMLCDVAIAGMFKHASYAGFDICPVSYPRLAAYLERVWHTPAFATRLADEKAMLAMFEL